MFMKLIQRANTFLKSAGKDRLRFIKMAETLEALTSKRAASPEKGDQDSKKLKVDDTSGDPVSADVVAASENAANSEIGTVVLRKKKVALFMMYSGVGYYGMQVQQGDSGHQTIEGELMEVLKSVGAIPEEHVLHPQKMSFQRAARTDKGVSAAGNCVSLKLLHNIPNLKDKINTALPEPIKVIDIIRTTATFDSKNYCDARTYSYMLPTFAFTPVEEVVFQSFRAPDGMIKRVNDILSIYKGTHNFHNFTSGKKPNEMSANRFIIDMKCSEPFIQDDVEFAVITVKGQSFMLHQIRKMIGLMIAVMRGLASVDSIQKAFGPYKVDVPKAPGLGLMLEKLHYDTYNRRYGNDGLHRPLEFDVYHDDIEEFKKKFIYSTMINTEKKEKSMMNWMSTLFSHNYDYRVNIDMPVRSEIGTGRAEFLVEKGEKRKETPSSESEKGKETPSLESENGKETAALKSEMGKETASLGSEKGKETTSSESEKGKETAPLKAENVNENDSKSSVCRVDSKQDDSVGQEDVKSGLKCDVDVSLVKNEVKDKVDVSLVKNEVKDEVDVLLGKNEVENKVSVSEKS